MNKAIEGHPLIGETFVFRPDLPPYAADEDTEPGVLLAGHGHRVTVLAVFADWNGVGGLDMYYVECLETLERLHLSPNEIHGTVVAP